MAPAPMGIESFAASWTKAEEQGGAAFVVRFCSWNRDFRGVDRRWPAQASDIRGVRHVV